MEDKCTGHGLSCNIFLMTGQRRLKEKFPTLYPSLFLTAFTTEKNWLINDSILKFTQSKFSLKVLMSKPHTCTHCFDKENHRVCRICCTRMRFLGVGREKTESQGLSVGTAPREPLPARKVLELQKTGNAELQKHSWELFPALESQDALLEGTLNPIQPPAAGRDNSMSQVLILSFPPWGNSCYKVTETRGRGFHTIGSSKKTQPNFSQKPSRKQCPALVWSMQNK